MYLDTLSSSEVVSRLAWTRLWKLHGHVGLQKYIIDLERDVFQP